MTQDETQVLEYALDASMEEGYDQHQRSRGSFLTVRMDEDNVEVYNGQGGKIGDYDLETLGPFRMDRISGEESAEYTVREVLEETVGEEDADKVMRDVGVKDAELNTVHRRTVPKSKEVIQRTSMPTATSNESYEIIESFEATDLSDMDFEGDDTEFDEYGQIK